MDTHERTSTFPATARARGKIAPVKLAHIVLNTPRYRQMVEWYKTVLEAVPVFENDFEPAGSTIERTLATRIGVW